MLLLIPTDFEEWLDVQNHSRVKFIGPTFWGAGYRCSRNSARTTRKGIPTDRGGDERPGDETMAA